MSPFLTTYAEQINSHLTSDYHCQQALKTLLAAQFPGLDLDHDPQRAAIGAPPFILWRGSSPVGYIFPYAPGTSLDAIENAAHTSAQNAALTNVIRTNYLEFRWYTHARKQQTSILGKLVNQQLQLERNTNSLMQLLQAFSHYTPTVIEHAQPLAARMGTVAGELRRLLAAALTVEPANPELSEQLTAFRSLIPDITPETFADMYAQAFVCALFLARVRHQGAARQKAFNRRDLYWDLPPTSAFLRVLFQAVNNGPLDARVAWLVDALADQLTHTAVEGVLQDFTRRTRQEDPLSQFYETFLNHYLVGEADGLTRGISYTPEPVVSYILRSVDQLLRKRFDQALGIASEKALIIDPAVGSGTFLYLIIQQIYDTLRQQRQLGAWDAYTRDDLLPRVVGLDIRLAPYAITHMKLAIQLRRMGYSFASNQRLRVYLANALDSESAVKNDGDFAQLLQAEMQAAHLTSGDYPMLVMIGNPPQRQYAANTARPGFDDLEQDYARFLRLGQQLISQHEAGIMAFITHNDFLTNPDMAPLRQQLLNTFHDAYFLNLHGQDGEQSPEGGADENVFDSAQGLVISLFIRREGHRVDNRVYYADWWGTRAEKYTWLLEHDLYDTDWQRLTPQAPDYLFVPHALHQSHITSPETGWPLAEIFPVAVSGVAVEGQAFYTRAGAEETAQRQHIPPEQIHQILYRPFDPRYLLCSAEQTQAGEIIHMTGGGNIALCVQSASATDYEGGHVLCANLPIHADCMQGAAVQYPLYLLPHPQAHSSDSPFPPDKDGRRPNVSHKFILTLANRLHMTFIPQGRGDLKYTFAPEDIFSYSYALLHSMNYRARPGDSLPPIALPVDKKRFRLLVKKGRQLIALHLLRKADARRLTTGFNGPGGSEIAPKHPLFIELAGEPGGRIYINDNKFFDAVDRRVWKYQAGGYAVLHEWLTQRQGQVLDWREIYAFQQIIETLRQTFHVMDAIDEITGNG